MEPVTFLTNVDEQRIGAGVIPAPTSAEVGQAIVVKSVDDAGRPLEWETVDLYKEKKTKLITVTDVTLDHDVVLSGDGTNDTTLGDAVVAAGHYFYKTQDGEQLKAKRIYGYITTEVEFKTPSTTILTAYYKDGTPNAWNFGDYIGNYTGIVSLGLGGVTVGANRYFVFEASVSPRYVRSGVNSQLTWDAAAFKSISFKAIDTIVPYFSGLKLSNISGTATLPAGARIVIKAEVEDNA